ncbi:hypothetical protein [Fuscovulum blasticum]|uniref:hypothetical protein n=1 Tax=Fuscovulum blasticum TaxID=1075 RepID=UPI000F5064A7|nr:hypothetical protein [Fuscovulum blasticum]
MTFAQRFQAACDASESIPSMHHGKGRLQYIAGELRKRNLSVSLQSVSRWHSGAATPRDKYLIELSKILNATPEWLRFGANTTSSQTPVQVGGLLEHRFRLRPDLEITLSLPANLTEKEAERLARFILTTSLA